MTKPVDVTAQNFEEEVVKEAFPVLVDFWSASCPHCQRLNPDFEKAAEQAQGKVKFAKVSVQDARPLFAQHNVNAVPTMILFQAGKELARQEGALSPQEISAWLEQHL